MLSAWYALGTELASSTPKRLRKGNNMSQTFHPKHTSMGQVNMVNMLASFPISARWLGHHRARTIFAIIVIASAISVPLSVGIILDNTLDASYTSLSNTGLDDVSILYDTLRPVDTIFEELLTLSKFQIETIEPRVRGYSRLLEPSTGRYASGSLFLVLNNDTWFNGLILDAGEFPSSEKQIAVGRELADLLDLQPGSLINITTTSLNLAMAAEVSGIVHERGLLLNKFCVGLCGILRDGDQFISNHVGLKLRVDSFGVEEIEKRTLWVAAEIETTFEGTSVTTPKLSRYAPIKDAIGSSRLFFSMILWFSFLSAGAAAFSYVTVSLNESIHEIGLMRAIGLPKRFILFVFVWIPLFIGLPAILLSLLFAAPIAIVVQSSAIEITRALFLRDLSSELVDFSTLGGFDLMVPSVWSIVMPTFLGLLVVILGGLLPVFRTRNLTAGQALMPHRGLTASAITSLIRRGIVALLFLALYVLTSFRLFDGKSILAGRFEMEGELSGLMLLMLVLSFGWFLSGAFPKLLEWLVLPKQLGGNFQRLANKSLLARRNQFNFAVMAIAVSVLVVLISRAYMNGMVETVSDEAYQSNGGDLLIEGRHDIATFELIRNTSGVDCAGQILTAEVLDTVIDSHRNIHGDGEILSFFVRNSSELSEVIHWTPVTRSAGLDLALRNLDSRSGIILTTILSDYLGKSTGDSVRLDLSIGEGNETEIVYSSEYVISAVADFIPGLPFGNPLCLMPARELVDLGLLVGNRVLVKLEDPSFHRQVSSSISNLGLYFRIESTPAEIQAFTELTGVIAGVILSVVVLSVIMLSMTLFSVIASTVLARQYDYGVLRAIGFTMRQVYSVVVFEGFMIGLTGLALGLSAFFWVLVPSLISQSIGISPAYIILSIDRSVPVFEMAYLMVLTLSTTSFAGCLAAAFLRRKTIIALTDEETY